MADANLIVKIGALVDSSLDRATRTAVNRIKTLGNELASVGSTFALGLTAPIAAFGAATIKAGAEIESLKLALKTLEGTTANVERRFKELQEVAKLPGLGVREAVEADLTLRSFGLTAERAKEATLAFGNALAAAGRGKADLAETVRQFGQLSTSAKLTAEDLKPVIQRVPQVAQLLREKFNTANAEALRDLGVTTKQVIDVIITGLQKIPPVTSGLKNTLENFSDTTQQALAKVGDALTPFISRFLDDFAGPAIKKVSELAIQFSKLSPETQNFAVAATGLAAGLPIVALGLGKVVTLATEAAALFARFPALGVAAVAAGIAVTATVAYNNISQVNERLEETLRIQEAITRGELKLPKVTGTETYDEFLAKLKELNKEFFDKPWARTAEESAAEFKKSIEGFSSGLKIIDTTKKATAELGPKLKAVKIELKEIGALKFDAKGLIGRLLDQEAKQAISDYEAALIRLRAELKRLQEAAAQPLDFLFGGKGASLDGGPLAGIFEESFKGFVLTGEQIEIATKSTKDFVAEVAKLPGETRLVEEAWARVAGQIEGVPQSIRVFNRSQVKDAVDNIKKATKEFDKEQKAQERAAAAAQRHIERYFHKTAEAMAEVIFKSDSVGKAFKKLGLEIGKSLASAAIEAQLKKLTKLLLDWASDIGKTGIGKVLGGLFGVDLSKGGLIIKNASGAAGSVGGAAAGAAGSGGSAASSAASAATSGLAGIVTAVASAASAISGVVSNFQLAGVNKSLDLIEHEVRYSQIHLLSILEKANEYWPWMRFSHDRLRQMLEAGVPVFNAAGDQGLRLAGGGTGSAPVFNIDMRNSTFGGSTTEETAREVAVAFGRQLALVAGVR